MSVNKHIKEMSSKTHLIQSYVALVLAIVINVLFMVALSGIQSFSGLSKDLFVIVNLGVLGLLLLINILVLLQFRSRKPYYFYAVLIVMALALAAGAYGSFLIGRINNTVGEIIVNGNVTESVDLAVVVNTEADNPMTELNEVHGKTVGIIQESLNAEITHASMAEFEEKGIEAEFVEYTGYQEIILALLKNEIDSGILPKNYAYMFASEDEQNDYMAALSTIYEYSRIVEMENSVVGDVNVATDPITVLIIGMDESHSDVLMLATFNPLAFEVTYTSIARDSLVPICGNGKQKIAHSRNYGRACTIQTVEDLMDIKIDYFFEANFQGVVDMVDAVGGIDIWSTKEFVGQSASYNRGTYTVKIFEGFNFVNGEGALAFARERKAFSNGDFQRQLNQQQVITSFLTKLTEVRDVNTALAVLEAAGENVKTNIPLDVLVELFNLVLEKIDNSFEKGFDALKIKSSRVTGYSSQQYDGSLELMLYTYSLFNGSIEENRNLLVTNTDLENVKIPEITELKWSANWEYSSPTTYHEWFDEPRVSEPVPDLVGNWVGQNISSLKSWAAERNINLNIIYVDEDDQGYDSSLTNGTILTQDMPALRMTSKVSSMTVSVINVVPKVPDFTTMKLKDIKQVNWSNDYGFDVVIKYVKSHDASGHANENYVPNKVGAVASQNVPYGTKSDGTFTKVEIDVYDYPYVIVNLPKASDGLEAIKTWASTHLIDSETPIVYVEEKITHDQELDGTVVSVSAVLEQEPFVKTNGKLAVQLYKYEEEPSIAIPDFVGKLVSELTAWANTYGVIANGEESSTECAGNDISILEFSGVDGLSEIKPSVLYGKTVTYKYCKVPIPEPTPEVTPEPVPTPDSTESENTETPGE